MPKFPPWPLILLCCVTLAFAERLWSCTLQKGASYPAMGNGKCDKR